MSTLLEIEAVADSLPPEQQAELVTFLTSRLVLSAGVSELKIDVGPGYRVYYSQRGEKLLLLLAGGDKSSQQRDIAKALELNRNLTE